MSTVNLDIINQYTGDLEYDIETVRAAFQVQVTEHFLPLWEGECVDQSGLVIDVVNVRIQTAEQPDGWPIFLQALSDVKGALAYHILASNGKPQGFVFVDTDKEAGDPWTVDLSHEGLEMLGDWSANGKRRVGLSTIAIEVSDPVQQLQYPINGVPMSDFVTPAYFDISNTPGQLDYLKSLDLNTPGEILPGGYLIEYRHGRAYSVFGSELAATRFNHRHHHRLNARLRVHRERTGK